MSWCMMLLLQFKTSSYTWYSDFPYERNAENGKRTVSCQKDTSFVRIIHFTVFKLGTFFLRRSFLYILEMCILLGLIVDNIWKQYQLLNLLIAIFLAKFVTVYIGYSFVQITDIVRTFSRNDCTLYVLNFPQYCNLSMVIILFFCVMKLCYGCHPIDTLPNWMMYITATILRC